MGSSKVAARVEEQTDQLLIGEVRKCRAALTLLCIAGGGGGAVVHSSACAFTPRLDHRRLGVAKGQINRQEEGAQQAAAAVVVVVAPPLCRSQ